MINAPILRYLMLPTLVLPADVDTPPASQHAIVTEVSGVSDIKRATPFTVSSGFKIDLGSAGKMRLIDYDTCVEVAVTGGTMQIEMDGITVLNEKVVEAKQGCDRDAVWHLKSGVPGGVAVVRPSFPTLPTHPLIVLLAPQPLNYRSITFVPDSGPPIEAPLKDGIARLPATGIPQGAYKLSIHGERDAYLDGKVLVINPPNVGVGQLQLLKID